MTNTIRSPRHVPRSPDGALLALPWEPQSRLPSSIIGIIIIVLRSYAPHSCTGLQLPRPSSLDHRVLHTWLEVIRQSRHTVRLQERSARRGRQCQTRRSSSQFISSLPFLPSPPPPSPSLIFPVRPPFPLLSSSSFLGCRLFVSSCFHCQRSLSPYLGLPPETYLPRAPEFRTRCALSVPCVYGHFANSVCALVLTATSSGVGSSRTSPLSRTDVHSQLALTFSRLPEFPFQHSVIRIWL